MIRIDEDLCDRCGNCIIDCPEGALQLIDGKARVVNEAFCDGLGACIGVCPTNAITVEIREAEAYSEAQVVARMVDQGAEVLKAHLQHLESHGETEYLREALEYLEANGIPVPKFRAKKGLQMHPAGGRPEAAEGEGDLEGLKKALSAEPTGSELRHWPIQMHLISPDAPDFRNADLLMAADCVAYALGSFHQEHLKGKRLVVACPKLDRGVEEYVAKLTQLIDEAEISSITAMIMQVPCCAGLLRIITAAQHRATREVPLKAVTVGTNGSILDEKWV